MRRESRASPEARLEKETALAPMNQRGSVESVGLRKLVAQLGFHFLNIRVVDLAINSHILAEVGSRDRLTGLRCRLLNVFVADEPVLAGIAEENIHSHERILDDCPSLVVHAVQANNEMLSIRDTGEIQRELIRVRAECGAADHPGALGHAGGRLEAGHELSLEGTDDRVNVVRTAAAAFNTDRKVRLPVMWR